MFGYITLLVVWYICHIFTNRRMYIYVLKNKSPLLYSEYHDKVFFFILRVAHVKLSRLNPLQCKNIRRFYGKITGNQLPIHFPLFLQAPVNIFRNQALNDSKGHYCFFFFFVKQPYNPTKVFSSTVG